MVIAPSKHLYLPDYWSEEDVAIAVGAFEAAGYVSMQVCKAGSIDMAVEQLESGVVLLVYSLDLFGSVDELSELLVRMQARGVLLQSLREPWLNEVIRDHANNVGKMRDMISRKEQ